MKAKTVDLGLTFNLIKKIKKGIKQKCTVNITDSNVPGNLALCIEICTKDPKTKKFLCFERVVNAVELGYISEEMQLITVENIINEANKYFKNKIKNNLKEL